jgi:hypothetical protein
MGANGIREAGRAGARQIGKVDRKEPYADMTDSDEQGPWEGRLTHASFEFGLCCRELDDSNPYSAEPGIPPALVQVMVIWQPNCGINASARLKSKRRSSLHWRTWRRTARGKSDATVASSSRITPVVGLLGS